MLRNPQQYTHVSTAHRQSLFMFLDAVLSGTGQETGHKTRNVGNGQRRPQRPKCLLESNALLTPQPAKPPRIVLENAPVTLARRTKARELNLKWRSGNQGPSTTASPVIHCHSLIDAPTDNH